MTPPYAAVANLEDHRMSRHIDAIPVPTDVHSFTASLRKMADQASLGFQKGELANRDGVPHYLTRYGGGFAVIHVADKGARIQLLFINGSNTRYELNNADTGRNFADAFYRIVEETRKRLGVKLSVQAGPSRPEAPPSPRHDRLLPN